VQTSYIDGNIEAGKKYYYCITAVDYSGNESGQSGEVSVLVLINSNGDYGFLVKEFLLEQNYPNPFNPATQIRFALPKAEQVKIEVYNTIGERVAILIDSYLPAGYHQVQFDGQDLSSGVYLYRIQAGAFHDVKKMILIR
jgi:hypothetical protein